jgi:magnesium-protoporphyrin IX monomethyl ester (oxidative) cyclase
MTLNIQLINMPFGDLRRPSIGLTQLRSRLYDVHGENVRVGINYLNLEFGRLIGVNAYQRIALDQSGLVSGFGEWFFRAVAFPDIADNQATYLARFAHHFGPKWKDFIDKTLTPLRAQLSEILDMLIVQYRLDEADVVGLSSTFFQNLASFALAQRLRLRNPRQVIVMGGANCEGGMGATLIQNAPAIDFAFSGHSLWSFPTFIGHLLDGDAGACHRIDGVFSRRNVRPAGSQPPEPDALLAKKGLHGTKATPAGTAAVTMDVAPVGRELDINTLLEHNYDGYFAAFDRLLADAPLEVTVLFETSRGCWWGERAHCTFCGLNGATMAYRAMQPANAITLINDLATRYHARATLFECVDNILPREYIDGVFSRMTLPKNTAIFYEVKADLTADQLATLARGGVRFVQPGIEAIATSTLKLMRKGTTSFGNIKFLMHCMGHGVTPWWNLLVGFPGETAEVYEHYRQALPLLHHLPPPSGVYPVRFDRFSPYFNSPEEYGLKLEPYDFYEFCYPWPKDTLAEMAYYFKDTNYGAQYITDLAVAYTALGDLVQRWRDRWLESGGERGPRLTIRDEGARRILEDTRSGSLVESVISDAEFDLLTDAVRPTAAEELARHHGRDALDSAQAKGLLFGERGRLMCLLPDLDPEALDLNFLYSKGGSASQREAAPATQMTSGGADADWSASHQRQDR